MYWSKKYFISFSNVAQMGTVAFSAFKVQVHKILHCRLSKLLSATVLKLFSATKLNTQFLLKCCYVDLQCLSRTNAFYAIFSQYLDKM